MNFLIRGFSGCLATTCIQPLDFIKVQIQLRSEKGGQSLSPVAVAKEIYKENKSIKVFYAGYGAAISRQISYTSIRLGLFYTLLDMHKKSNNNQEPGFYRKMAFSMTAGSIGAFIANPCDLALVRMQNDPHLPVAERRNYKNVVNAMTRIASEEGFTKLWTGSGPTVARAVAMNLGLMVPFEETKSRLKPYVKSENMKSSLASCVAGFFGALFSLPFDNAKTKLQKMKVQPDGKREFNGLFDAMKKTVVKEGVFRLWVGFPTFYIRVAPHAVISLITNDVLRKLVTQKK